MTTERPLDVPTPLGLDEPSFVWSWNEDPDPREWVIHTDVVECFGCYRDACISYARALQDPTIVVTSEIIRQTFVEALAEVREDGGRALRIVDENDDLIQEFLV